MKTVTLITIEDRHGTTGLSIAGMSYDEIDAALSGDLIAHDLIEHVNGFGRIGMIDDEMEALGALYATRGQYGWLRRGEPGYQSCEENIAADFSRMAVDIVSGADYYPNRYHRPRRHHLFEDAFVEIRAQARQQFGAGLQYIHEGVQNLYRLGSYWDDVIPALRAGARKLLRRHKTYSHAHETFWNIADAVHPFCQHAEGYERYVLSYDVNRAIVREEPDPYGY